MVVGNCFGFVANRMLAYYMREAYLLLEEGASVPQIDGADRLRHAGRARSGCRTSPASTSARASASTCASIGKTRAEGPQSEVPDRLFEMGRYGQKTGAGWYRVRAPAAATAFPIR